MDFVVYGIKTIIFSLGKDWPFCFSNIKRNFVLIELDDHLNFVFNFLRPRALFLATMLILLFPLAKHPG